MWESSSLVHADAASSPSGAAVVSSIVAKRQRTMTPSSLPSLCWEGRWQEATERAMTHPEEATWTSQGFATPLALACRLGAPYACITAILKASPSQLRHLLPSRGTPLHEAIVCDQVGPDVIACLLERDEALAATDNTTERATLMQDVDGHTPLHLFIRRRFHSSIRGDEDDRWKALLELLVRSSPEAAGIPDRGEYEEPPLVMALKASLYAGGGMDQGDELFYQRLERRIHEMVQCMLQHYPQAASQVLTGARGQYTALHSAVFHGRCSDTIHLLLDAERQSSQAGEPAALLANTQGELPLHFAAMRGEPPRSIALLGNAAPMAVMARDTSGLTPLHWLWIRFVSTLLALDNERGETTVESLRGPSPGNRYQDFASLEKGDFDVDLNLIRRIDPPVDFLRMRHIPTELLGDESNAFEWADRSVEVLAQTRDRYRSQPEDEMVVWTRREAVTSLFWTKAVSLLEAAAGTMNDDSEEEFLLVHTALACSSCPPPVAHMACLLFPEELSIRDTKGRLPLHYATCRAWHVWDWPKGAATDDSSATGTSNSIEPAAVQILRGESLEVLQNAIDMSPPAAARLRDHDGRLAVHHAIDTFVRACIRSERSYIMTHKPSVHSMLNVLEQLVQIYPESLEIRDGKTKLYPFLQAAAAATEYSTPSSMNGYPPPLSDEMPLSIVYALLRENPSLVTMGIF